MKIGYVKSGLNDEISPSLVTLKVVLSQLSLGSTVVDNSTHNPNIKGSKLTTVSGRENNDINFESNRTNFLQFAATKERDI